MADQDDPPREDQQDGQKVKKRRLHGACDGCRKRKIKCDSAVMPGSICSNCQIYNIPCSHDAPRQPGRAETRQAYIQALEKRLEKLDRVFGVLHPDRDIETLLDLPLNEVSEFISSVPDPLASGFSLTSELRYPSPHLSATLLSDASSPELVNQGLPIDREEEEEENLSHVELTDHLNMLFIEDKRFFGQASSYMFAHHTMHAKMESSGSCDPYPLESTMLRRPLYWEMRPWELSLASSQEYGFVFPEPDLLNSLVALYFEKSNLLLPVLHEPTFLHSLTSGLHLRDSGFGMTVLAVCAIASRFTSDTRVLLDDDISSLSAGWKYYSQLPIFRKRLFHRTSLYDLQFYVLSTVYLLGTSMIHVAWPMLGLGLRFAQEKGLHRRKGMQERTAEDESEKRVFWSLIIIDRWMSTFLGRPCGMQDEEFDVEYPAECDDEYWETPDPKDAFRQPPGKPCKITYFIWTIKLAEILRSLYKKSKGLIGLIGTDWESEAVAKLDSSMNRLKDRIPHFLRWDPQNPDTTFFSQSIALYTCFYHLQMQIHRPFLMKRSALSFKSLAICNNAARSTAHLLEAAMSRGATLFPSVYMSAFSAASILLLNRWVYQQTDPTSDPMELVLKLFHILKDGERKWYVAGRLCDLTQILGCLSDYRSNSQLKRRRESLGIINHPNQQNYHGRPRQQQQQQASFAGETQVAAKLETPVVMQAFTNTWGDNYVSHQMGLSQPSYAQHSQVIVQPANPASFLAEPNFQHPASSQDAGLLDPHLLAHSFTERPMISTGLDMWDDLFEMWANVPMNVSVQEWDDFLSVAMPQPQAPSE